MMDIRDYRESDYPEIVSWYLGRRLVAPAEWTLSTNGLIVPGSAAGFLYTTNSGLCYLDNFITNRNSSLRLEAFHLIASGLMDLAGALGFKGVFAGASIESVANIGERLGMMAVKDVTIFGKEL